MWGIIKQIDFMKLQILIVMGTSLPKHLFDL